MQSNCITDLVNIQGVKVKEIKNNKNLEIFLYTNPKLHRCPSCNNFTNKVHDYRVQKIQHIPIGGKKTILYLNKRRYVCPCCNKRFYEDYSFVQRYFRKSNSLFNNVISNLKQSKNFKTIAEDNKISQPTVVRFMNYKIFMENKYSQIRTLPKHIGIDEFKGNCGSKYLFHIFDLDTHETVDIVNGKSYKVLEQYFSNIENRSSVEIVSMDLCKSFKRIIKDKFLNATIIADCFHFTRVVMNCLDELRLDIWRKSKGAERKYFKFLKHALMKDISKVTDKDVEKLLHAFEFSPILKYAYNLKNEFIKIKALNSYEEKEDAFKKWLYDTECSTIKQFKNCVKTLREWHAYISNYFKYGLSNGPTEGKNNLIKVIKRLSFGFRNFNNFRNRILILDLK